MKLKTLFLAAAAALNLAAPSGAQEVKFINLATATSGGTFYPAGIALTNLIGDKTEMRASAISSAGSVENVSLLRNGEVNMAFVQIDVAQNAIAGKGPFEGDGFEGMAMLTPLFSSVDHILVANDSGIESLADLEGKRIAAGRPGSGTLLSTQAVLASTGLTLDDIQVEYLGQSEAIAALQNGIIDATLVSAGIPATSVTEAVTVAGDKFSIYGMTPEEQSKVLENISWKIPFEVPAGTYPGQDAALDTTAHMALLMVPEDFPEATATEILETMYGNLEELGGMHAIYNSVTFERNAKAFGQLDVKKLPAAAAFFGAD
ncbi:TAXI family TRAP transporter solute-binding subunit [Salipiger abyssi]|uniref:TAXI family TRAP transporter solute-binding subunit n=1 Tax=Salipiger abyssi TaxID=1250539 RepID=UPI001A9073E3|nr:TAXI family TRAP transporter solute-binding subunit [Salipiger abyssi]MBN9885872.1 TAXI family TRAP transporter solute-binding subunit [Salipiger abyssi]